MVQAYAICHEHPVLFRIFKVSGVRDILKCMPRFVYVSANDFLRLCFDAY